MSISINALSPATLYAVSVDEKAPLWVDLSEEQQKPYLDVGMFLSSFLNGTNLRTFKREIAIEALTKRMGEAGMPKELTAAYAVHVYFHLASTFA